MGWSLIRKVHPGKEQLSTSRGEESVARQAAVKR
jgi:hypothetical protein